MISMREKTIVITGASYGIGAVTERRLSGNRHKIIIGHSSAETESVARSDVLASTGQPEVMR
jgi:NADP-dependent 3-hydroxy acid dehydrogenase YdfG